MGHFAQGIGHLGMRISLQWFASATTKQQLLSAQCSESSTFLLLFFRACLSEHIRHATDPEVQCPHQDENYACHATITGQEIQAVSGLLNGGEQQGARRIGGIDEREHIQTFTNRKATAVLFSATRVVAIYWPLQTLFSL